MQNLSWKWSHKSTLQCETWAGINTKNKTQTFHFLSSLRFTLRCESAVAGAALSDDEKPVFFEGVICSFVEGGAGGVLLTMEESEFDRLAVAALSSCPRDSDE